MLADDARVVHVPDGRMVELSQGFALTQKPGAGGLVGVEVGPQAHASLAGSRRTPRTAPAPPRPRRCARAGIGGRGPPGSGRTRGPGSGPVSGVSPAAARRARRAPHTAASHQRRLPAGESSVKKRLQCCAGAPAHVGETGRRGCRRPIGRWSRARTAARAGANWSRHRPLTRMSCWVPVRRASSSFIAAMAPPGAGRPAWQRLGERRRAGREAAGWRGSRPDPARGSSFRVSAHRRHASKSGRRSGGGSTRPRAVLTKSSQTASPRSVN